jgi:hypothetical protein
MVLAAFRAGLLDTLGCQALGGRLLMAAAMRTDFLFAQPSFLSGVARLADLWGALDSYNSSTSEEFADSVALYSDWRVTGEDLIGAMGKMDEELRCAQTQQANLFDD